MSTSQLSACGHLLSIAANLLNLCTCISLLPQTYMLRAFGDLSEIVTVHLFLPGGENSHNVNKRTHIAKWYSEYHGTLVYSYRHVYVRVLEY